MRFEKLTDAKIKIVLSLKDLEKNNLSTENILSNSVDSQKLINKIINKAEQELDFEPEDSQLLVEAVISSPEECIFTITKLSNSEVCCSLGNCSFIIKFDCFENFLNLCSFLKNFSNLCLKELSKNFSLIYYNNTYYLKFTETDFSSISIDYVRSLFMEFGNDVSLSPCIDGILNEYGKIIFKTNAISMCINCFCT